MKLSSRERALISLLVGAVAIGGGTKYLWVPTMAEKKEKELVYQSLKDEELALQDLFITAPLIEKNLANLTETMPPKLDQYFPIWGNEYLHTWVHRLIVPTGATIEQMDITDPIKTSLADSKVLQQSMNLELKGSSEQVLAIIKRLEESGRLYHISTLDMREHEATLGLNVYVIPKEMDDELDYPYSKPTGKNKLM